MFFFDNLNFLILCGIDKTINDRWELQHVISLASLGQKVKFEIKPGRKKVLEEKVEFLMWPPELLQVAIPSGQVLFYQYSKG